MTGHGATFVHLLAAVNMASVAAASRLHCQFGSKCRGAIEVLPL
jgi:hypothetical protein